MRILVSGASGLIGGALVEHFAYKGHDMLRLVRKVMPKRVNQVTWDPVTGHIDHRGLEGLDAIVHLAGENIAGRWKPEKKDRIRNSRVHGTEFLANNLQVLAQPPKTLLCASAVGYYGNRGNEVLTESSEPGEDFLAQVCREWEAATQPAQAAGIRVVNLRFGHVLSAKGGLLKKMLLPYKLGLGGILGTGRQYMSWIAMDDLLNIVTFLLAHDKLVGPVNVVSPTPVTNREFTHALAAALRRPALMRVPYFALRASLGELAGAVVASTRAIPEKLTTAGYNFKYPTIDAALHHILHEKRT